MNLEKFTDEDVRLANLLSNATTEGDKYIVLLNKQFGYSLTKSELSQVLKWSEQTIDRRIKEASNIPRYLRSSNSDKATYTFPVVDVAKFLAHCIKVL